MPAAMRVAAFLGAYFAANAINASMALDFADRGLSASAIGQVLGAAALPRVLTGPSYQAFLSRVIARVHIIQED
ncbi:MAG: hypothetical protein ABSC06_01140 [Rhodopila sp.]|jgi:hypothetical protein